MDFIEFLFRELGPTILIIAIGGIGVVFIMGLYFLGLERKENAIVRAKVKEAVDCSLSQIKTQEPVVSGSFKVYVNGATFRNDTASHVIENQVRDYIAEYCAKNAIAIVGVLEVIVAPGNELQKEIEIQSGEISESERVDHARRAAAVAANHQANEMSNEIRKASNVTRAVGVSIALLLIFFAVLFFGG